MMRDSDVYARLGIPPGFVAALAGSIVLKPKGVKPFCYFTVAEAGEPSHLLGNGYLDFFDFQRPFGLPDDRDGTLEQNRRKRIAVLAIRFD